MVEYGRENMAIDSSSMSITTVPPVAAESLDYRLYPSPLATYEEVVASPHRFLETLQKFHASMRTKFRIPIVGGQELDLFRLFVEVTSRGGVMKTLNDKKWKEVTCIFNFPASATNACFILRKHYFAMLYHFEQVYYLKAKGWSPSTIGTFESTSKLSVTPLASVEPKMSPLAIQAARPEKERERFTEQSFGGARSSSGTTVNGVVDGKFDGGYLITVQIGMEKCRGILYQTLVDTSGQEPQQHQTIHQYHNTSVNVNNSSALAPRVIHRRRKRKSEQRKRDPGHPKPNRSGYNFFFKEHHAKLKELYPGKDKAVSRIVGESWNKLSETEKAEYREKAAKDKERYRREMQSYRERTGAGQNPHESHLNTPQNQSMSNQHVSTFQNTTDSGSMYPQPYDTDNLEELDNKFQSDDNDSSGSSFENENSSNMSEDSESDVYTTQTTGMQEHVAKEMRDHKEKMRDMTDGNAGDDECLGKKAEMGFADNQRMQNAS